MLRASRASLVGQWPWFAAWIGLAGLAAGVAIEIRPQSTVVVAGYLIAAALLLFDHLRSQAGNGMQSIGAKGAAAAAICGLLGLLAPLVPQVVFNQTNFQKLSPLPIVDVVSIQTGKGIGFLRSATNASGCGVGPLDFPNPLADYPGEELPYSAGQVLAFLLGRWPEGPATATLHVFSALDPRPFITYVTDIDAPYEIHLQVLTVATLLAAFLGVLAVASNSAAQQRSGYAFLTIVAVLTLGVVATTAAQYRFGVLIMASASLLAMPGLVHFRRLQMVESMAFAALAVVATAGWILLSRWVTDTSAIWQVCGRI